MSLATMFFNVLAVFEETHMEITSATLFLIPLVFKDVFKSFLYRYIGEIGHPSIPSQTLYQQTHCTLSMFLMDQICFSYFM